MLPVLTTEPTSSDAGFTRKSRRYRPGGTSGRVGPTIEIWTVLASPGSSANRGTSMGVHFVQSMAPAVPGSAGLASTRYCSIRSPTFRTRRARQPSLPQGMEISGSTSATSTGETSTRDHAYGCSVVEVWPGCRLDDDVVPSGPLAGGSAPSWTTNRRLSPPSTSRAFRTAPIWVKAPEGGRACCRGWRYHTGYDRPDREQAATMRASESPGHSTGGCSLPELSEWTRVGLEARQH